MTSPEVRCKIGGEPLPENDRLPMKGGHTCWEHAAELTLSQGRRGRMLVLARRMGRWARGKR